MQGIPIIVHRNSVGSSDIPTAGLLLDDSAIVGGRNGTLRLSDPSLTSIKRQANIINSPIISIKHLSSLFAVHGSDGKVLIVNDQLEILETLPFKSISHQTIHSNRLAISTKNQIFIFKLINGQIEMVSQYKLKEKIIKFEITNDNEIVWSNGSSFYTYFISNDESTQLPFNSKFSVFNQFIDIVPIDDTVLISRGKDAAFIKDSKIVKTYQWKNSPQSEIIVTHPFLILNTNNHIYIKDSKNLRTLQTLNLVSVESISIHGDKLLTVSNSTIQIFNFNSFNTIVESITDVKTSIDFVQQLSIQQYPEKFNKLRDLNIQIGLKSFSDGNYQVAFNKFIEFVAPPFQIIKLYPNNITGYPNGVTASDKDNFKLSINLLTHFITDQRRKVSKLISTEEQSLPYQDGKITIEFFTEGKYSVDEILEVLDTTLFNLYIENNPGLIGSLVRVHNHLNEQTVISKLQEKKMINELIDFYFKRNLHGKALQTLDKLYNETSDSRSLVRYLQRLDNDNLELIFKFSKPLIEKDKSIGLKIFVDSVNSTELNQYKVQSFLNGISTSLEMKYLEFKIVDIERWDDSKVLNLKLLQIYLIYFSESEFDENSEYYPKLTTLLKRAAFNFDEVIRLIEKYKEPNCKPLLTLKTLVLFRFDKHEEAIKIIILKLERPEEIVDYLTRVNDLYSKSGTLVKVPSKYERIFLKTIQVLQDSKNKKIILKILSIKSLTDKISVSKIFELLSKNKSSFTIHELQNLLISNISETTKANKYIQLTKNLKYVHSVNLQNQLMSLNKFKIVENETKCHVCQKQFSSTGVIYCIPETYNAYSVSSSPKGNSVTAIKLNDIENTFLKKGITDFNYKVVHFGCLEDFNKLQSKPEKLRTIKLGDFDAYDQLN